ncbi:MAG: hypothetical protein HZC02_02745 [Candidatus Levybacteria bacterium]|nr:hypothetical protein [Candidatus Levybacteria bacterium]
MQKLTNIGKAFWPQIILACIVILIGIIHNKPETWLTGWDNLHPEFYFEMNIKRSLFAVWQEYQGLGLLGGMGHASDLPRQLFLALLSVLVPPQNLRFLWMMLMLLSGTLGMYVFLRHLIFANKERVYPFMGALFYLLNIATVQTFFVPFEAFIAHFGFLPWMLFLSLSYCKNPTRKKLLLLSLGLLLSSPAAYIPTLFLVYMLALGVIVTITYLLGRKKQILTGALKLFGTITVINAFWLLPFLYFTATNSHVNLNSKINQMATQTIYLQNKEFGGIMDTMLLKGFWFQNVDPDREGNFVYMLKPWRDHYQHPLVALSGLLLFGVITVGLVWTIRKKDRSLYPYIGLFIFCLTVLAVATPPFSLINILYRQTLPIFNQAFRFPFTKFSILTALSYAIFFSIGIEILVSFLKKRGKNHALLGILTGVILLGITLFPVFKGNMLYNKQQLVVPREYFDLFDFFKKQDPNTRIANFPQHTFWGWNFYNWNYGGSGFLWYGIKQPILDRAFDVWSSYDENYYYELSQALYAKDAKALENVLQKYQITWILIDENVKNPISPKALFLPQLRELIREIPTITKSEQFGKIEVYHVTLLDNPDSYIFGTKKLPTVNSYSWSNSDKAYLDFGKYENSLDPQVLYPFRSTSSQKTVSEQEFKASMSGDKFVLEPKNTITLSRQATLVIPTYSQLENSIPAVFEAQTKDNELVLTATLYPPQIWDNGKLLSGKEQIREILQIPTSKKNLGAKISINGVTSFPLKEGTLGTTFLSLTEDNIITLGSPSAALDEAVIQSSQLRNMPALLGNTHTLSKGDHVIKVVSPLINDNYLGLRMKGNAIEQKTNCDQFRTGPTQLVRGFETLTFMSVNGTSCGSFYMGSLPHNQGYAIGITHRNLRGKSLHFWALNQDAQYAPIDTYLPDNKDFTTDIFLLPPQEKFGLAYSFHFDNASIGNETVENEIKDTTISAIPLSFISSLFVKSGIPNDSPVPYIQSVEHPNESLYVVKDQSEGEHTLVLSQAYDKGWKAYRLPLELSSSQRTLALVAPFLVGKPISSHTKINNWENGWTLTGSGTIVIVYLPQYLQYLGAALLVIFGGYVLITTLRKT